MQILRTLFSRNIIIGIHGLSNKPEKKLLDKWWIESIREGLSGIGRDTSFVFKSVYWADLLYEEPQSEKVKDPKDPLYLDDPYVPGDPGAYSGFVPNEIRKKVLNVVDKKINKLFFDDHKLINVDKIADLIIRKMYSDLAFYYDEEYKINGIVAGEAIRERLEKLLYKYRKKRILLIGHSMGSIISYDVLMKGAAADLFITIGSPLGLPFILKRNIKSQSKGGKSGKMAESPEKIKFKWYNFSDLSDSVALVYRLADYYKTNSRGIGPEDKIIYNNYENNGKRDPHKLYGYLRAPEVANVIYEFCAVKPGVFSRFKNLFYKAK